VARVKCDLTGGNKRAGAKVIAAVRTCDADCVRSLGADKPIDTQNARFEERAKDMDAVIDTIGGETLDRSFEVLRPGGVLVSSVATPDQEKAAQHGARAVFFLVEVTSEGLNRVADLPDSGQPNHGVTHGRPACTSHCRTWRS
jgi:NADPH:quinone reductase-like Zn-dependent oxidoreductase